MAENKTISQRIHYNQISFVSFREFHNQFCSNFYKYKTIHISITFLTDDFLRKKTKTNKKQFFTPSCLSLFKKEIKFNTGLILRDEQQYQ